MVLNKKLLIGIFLILGVVGTLLRIYHVEFGLPQTFYADEPEIAEPAITNTYELKNAFKNNDFYRLMPISYVYGTFPTYVLTLFIMGFSKAMSVMHISFDKFTVYVGMRSLQATLSMIIPIMGSLLAYKLIGSKNAAITTFGILALNWKLIVHAHYINGDIFLTGLYILTLYYLYKYYEKGPDDKYTVHAALAYGLCYGTKITALLTLPAILYLFIKKKDFFGFIGFGLTSLIAFIISNPFSVVFSNDFISRVLGMGTKEAGLVFDSVDYSPFKGIMGIAFMLGIGVLLFSLHGIYVALKNKELRSFNVFLLLNVISYIVFFSIQSRRVDRWFLPIIPILVIYFAYAVDYFIKKRQYLVLIGIIFVTGMTTLPNTIHLLYQFQRYTPKAEAYLWMQKNTDESKTKMVITEEGLDPMHKLPLTDVYQMQVYESEGAAAFLPPLTRPYDYIVLSSRPMKNYSRPEIRSKYPEYYKEWDSFNTYVTNGNVYKMIKGFETSKPNLIPLSDVYIYQRI